MYTRISGYGQTGPKASLPGYASVCEAYGGFRSSCYSWLLAFSVWLFIPHRASSLGALWIRSLVVCLA